MPNDNYELLREIALWLRNSEPPFFEKHNTAGLQAFLRDKGYCQYCAPPKYLYESYVALGDSATDHLLPRSKYPQFETEPRNLVACCMECNKIKRDWDPATDVEPKLSITTKEALEAQREVLIERTRTYICGNPDRWVGMFDDARKNFEKAVAEYRDTINLKKAS